MNLSLSFLIRKTTLIKEFIIRKNYLFHEVVALIKEAYLKNVSPANKNLEQGRATIYLNGPNCTIVLMLRPYILVPSKKAVVIIPCIVEKNFSINLQVALKYCSTEDPDN